MVRALFAVLFFVIAAGATARAADDKGGISQPDLVVDKIALADVVAMLKEMGGEEVESKMVENIPVVTFKSGGNPYVVVLGCPAAGTCDKVTVICYFAGEYPLEYVNKFNQDIDLLTVVREKKGVYSVRNTVNMAGGVTRANLANALATFVAAAPQVLQYLNSQVVAGLPDTDPALRGKETIWQAMVLQPNMKDVVARANGSRSVTGVTTPGHGH